MATYSGPSIRANVELVYTVPAEVPFGACWPEVEKAVIAMINSLRSLGVLKETEHPSDDLIRIVPMDDEVRLVATIKDFTAHMTSTRRKALEDLIKVAG